jgi:hypothetical protein
VRCRFIDVYREESEPAPLCLTPGVFVVLAAVLACMAAVPAAFWLADESLLPWAEELRWDKLRAADDRGRAPAPGSVELTRSGCFGSCPIYSVRLSTTGRVEFEGVAFVCAEGVQSATIPAAQARELIADIADAGFFDIAWNQGGFIADASDSAVVLQYLGRRRSLPNIDADSNSPRLLRRIAREIDEVSGTRRWLPRLEHGRRICADGAAPRGQGFSPGLPRSSNPLSIRPRRIPREDVRLRNGSANLGHRCACRHAPHHRSS